MADTAIQEAHEDGHALRMGFFEHLDELRQRLTRAVLSLVVGATIGIFFTDRVLMLLQEPYCSIPTVNDCELVILNPTGNIIIYFKVALMVGGILSIPMVTYQLLMFILPGLTRKEKRYVLLSIPATTVLFCVGFIFAWRILMPPALGFLNEFQGADIRARMDRRRLHQLRDFAALLDGRGLSDAADILPHLAAGLGQRRHVDPTVAHRRRWRIHRRRLDHATIDPVNMFLVMAPLLALYTLSIVLVFFGRKISGVDRTD